MTRPSIKFNQPNSAFDSSVLGCQLASDDGYHLSLICSQPAAAEAGWLQNVNFGNIMQPAFSTLKCSRTRIVQTLRYYWRSI